VSGSRMPEGWANERELVDFYDAKADVEALLAYAGDGGSYRFVVAEHSALHPGQTARIERDGRLVGYIGRLHPELAGNLGIDQPVYLFELLVSEIAEGRSHSSASCRDSLRCGGILLCSSTATSQLRQ